MTPKPREEREPTSDPRQVNFLVDVWYCDRCKREWTVPSIPHKPQCPNCGRVGWWQRFKGEYDEPLNSR